jgi:hypothetical protein
VGERAFSDLRAGFETTLKSSCVICITGLLLCRSSRVVTWDKPDAPQMIGGTGLEGEEPTFIYANDCQAQGLAEYKAVRFEYACNAATVTYAAGDRWCGGPNNPDASPVGGWDRVYSRRWMLGNDRSLQRTDGLVRLVGLWVTTMWIERFYPELHRIPTGSERRAIERRAGRRCGSNPLVILGVFALIVSVIVALRPLRFALLRLLPVDEQFVYRIAAAIGCLTGTALFRMCSKRVVARAVRKEMAARGYPICVGCGYDVTGLIEPRCPECATPLERADSTSNDSGVD